MLISTTAARPTTLDALPFSPTAAVTTTIYRQCSTYQGTPRPRSRSHSSATADQVDSVDDSVDDRGDEEDNKADEVIASADGGERSAFDESDPLENSMDHTARAAPSEQVFLSHTSKLIIFVNYITHIWRRFINNNVYYPL